MKHLAVLTLVFLSTPALAHPGAHINPHAAANWLPLSLGLAIIAAAATAAWFRR